MMGRNILKNMIAIVVIAAAVTVCYENSLDGAFLFDDNHFITENDHIRYLETDSVDGFARGIQAIVQYNVPRSLLLTTFALHYTTESDASKHDVTFEPDTTSFHIVNIALHFLNAVMVFFLVKKITGWHKSGKDKWWTYFTALSAALLFSTAAVATEGVTYIVGRSNSLCAFFILAALLVFFRARKLQERDTDEDGETKRKSVSWILALLPTIYLIYKLLGIASVPATYAKIAIGLMFVGWVFWLLYLLSINKGNLQIKADLLTLGAWCLFGMAAITKELAVVFPFLALLLDGLVLSGGMRGYMRKRLKYHYANLGTVAAGAALFIIITASMPPASRPKDGQTLDPAYLATQVSGPVMMDYLGQFLVPTNLNFDSPLSVMTPEEASQPANILTPYLLGLALIFAFTLWIMRRSRMFAAGIFWYFICLVPSSSILKLLDVMDEGRIYLSIIGLCWAISVAITAACKRCNLAILRPAIVLPLIAIIVLNGVNTRKRNEQYASPLLMWQDSIAKSPDNSRAYEALGYEFMNLNNTQERIRHQAMKLRGINKYLEDEGSSLDQKIAAIHLDVKERRLKYLGQALGEQRRNLNAALMLFRAIRDFGENDIPLVSPSGGTPKQLSASKTHHNLNMGVVYAMHTNTLEQIYNLYQEGHTRSANNSEYAELGLYKTRGALHDQMQATRFTALGILNEASQFSSPRQPQPWLNYATMCIETSEFYMKAGLIAQYEYFANEAQQATFFILAYNPLHYTAISALLKNSSGLANFYAGTSAGISHINKYREIDCYEKISRVLMRMEQASGQQLYPKQLSKAKDKIEKLQKEIAANN